jgi:hypothetical protein
MGALHALTIVVSLRGPKTALRALCFVTLATALSAITPLMGLMGSELWFPFDAILREKNLGADAILVTGSAIGGSGYWLLVHLFWFRARRWASWLLTMALCATSTFLLGRGIDMFDGHDHGVAKIDPDAISPMLTVGWWLAFSTSLYWSEMSEHIPKSTASVKSVA